MADINFKITADNSNFINKLEQVKTGINNTSNIITQLGKNFDVSTVENKIVALNKVIKDNDSVITSLGNKLMQLTEQQKAAFADGDTSSLEAINKEIEIQAQNVQSLIEETNTYREALSIVEASAGSIASQPAVESPQFFKSQEDYEHVQALKESITELQSKIADFDGSSNDLQNLQQHLSSLQDELRENESAAAEAASRLGENLGGRAAEASTKLYELNTAIADQKETVASLADSVQLAKEELDRLRESNADTSEIEMAQVRYDSLSTSMQNASNELMNMQAKQADASSNWASVNSEVEQQDNLLVKLLGGQDKYNNIMSKMPPIVQASAKGIVGMTGAAKAFIATPLGAIIAAIVLALQALKTWFNSTVEGQLEFAKISGYVSGVLGQLKEVLINVGKALYSAFTDPKKAITELWEAIKQNFVNRLEAVGGVAMSVGRIIKAAFSLDFDEAKRQFGELGNQLLQLGTGVENLAQKTADYISGINDAAKATAEISKAEKELEIDMSKWEKHKAELEKIKAEASQSMYDTNMSAAERKSALETYKKVIDEQMRQELAFQDRKIALQEKKMSLTSNTIEDENLLRELQAERTRIEASASRELASLQRRANMIERSGGGDKADNKEYDLIKNNINNEIDLMEEGAQKKLKQIDADYDARKLEIEKKAKEFAELNRNNGLTNLNANGLTESQQSEINKANDINEQTKAKAENDYYNSLIDKYKSYTDERLEIEKKYDDDLSVLRMARQKAEAEGDQNRIDQINRSIAEATTNKGKALINQDIAALKDNPSFAGAFNNMQGTSTDTLEALLTQLQDSKTKAAEVLDPEALIQYSNEIQNILEELDSRDPVGRLGESVTALRAAKTELKNAQKDYNDVISGKKVPKEKDKNGKKSEITEYKTLEEVTKRYNKAQEDVNKASIRTDKIQIELTEQMSELASGIQGVGNAIGGQSGEIITFIGDISQFTIGATDGIKKVAGTAAQSLSALEKASVILGIISVAIQLFQKINGFLSEKSYKDYQKFVDRVKELNKLTEAVDQYKIAVLNAQHEEENWFGEDNLKKLRDYKEEHDAIAEAYNHVYTEQQATYQNKKGGSSWLRKIWGALNGGLVYDLLGANMMGNKVDYEHSITEAYKNLRIETQSSKKGGLFKKGRDQKTQDLQSWINDNKSAFEKAGISNLELFDDNNMINTQMVDFLVENYGNKLVGQTKETIEKLAELKEQYDEYQEQLHDYVSSLYQPLVTNMIDSIWEWFDSGKDALASFKDAASDTFRDIMNDMINTILLDKVFNGFTDDITALYDSYASGEISEQELMNKVAEKTEEVTENYEKQLPALQNMLTATDTVLQEKVGISLRDTSEQSASSGGFETMSQEVGTELSGRFAMLQTSGEEIKNQVIGGVIILQSISILATYRNEVLNNILNQQVVSNGYLEDIVKYTKTTAGFDSKIDRLTNIINEKL